MIDALEGFTDTVAISAGLQITILSFAVDINLIAGSNDKLADHTSRLDLIARRHGMGISSEKSNTMTTLH